MPATSNRARLFEESVIRRMTRVAQTFGAVNLSQGFPDFDPPRELTDALSVAAAEGPHQYQYAVTWGAADFRQALTAKQNRCTGLNYDADKHVVVTCGSTEAMRKTHDFLTVGAAAPLQRAALAGLELPSSYYEGLRAEYQGKRDLFLSLLDAAGVKYTTPDGAYYVLVDISEFDGENDTRFCEWLAEHAGVAAVPGSSFFRESVNHLIRFHFAKKEDTLKEAGRRLARLKELWQKEGYQ